MSSLTATRTTPRPEAVAPVQHRRRGLRLTPRGRMLVLLGLVLLLLGAFAIGRSASSQAIEVPSPSSSPAQVTVQSGDTLWSLARRVAPQRDARDVVTQIRRLNHLPTSSLQVGQQLLLPTLV